MYALALSVYVDHVASDHCDPTAKTHSRETLTGEAQATNKSTLNHQ